MYAIILLMKTQVHGFYAEVPAESAISRKSFRARAVCVDFYPGSRYPVFPMTIQTFFTGKTENVQVQLVRSILSSNIAFLLDFSLFALAVTVFRIPYMAAAPAAYIAGTSVAYYLNASWVFKERRFADKKVEYSLFLALGLGGLLLNSGIVWFCVEALSADPLRAKGIAGILVFAYNFVTRKLVVFTKTPEDGGS
jgi:putative flippase GtrA